MDKIYRATMRALGARPNGTGVTSCVDDAALVKQLLMLVSLAFTLGALAVGYQGLPARVEVVEKKIITVETIALSIDARLARIETELIRRR